MQKKYKRALIISIVSLVVFTLILILLGLGRVPLNQYALNYSTIMANYADSNVYGPGLYLIGIANKFIRINKDLQTLQFKNITSFSSDFYKINANFQISYFLNFTNSSYNDLVNYNINFGSDSNQVLSLIIKCQIINIISSKNSLFYLQTSNTIIQNQIKDKLTFILSRWVNVTINVIAQSIICEGTITNTQILDRKIQAERNHLERVINQKVQLSTLFNSIYQRKLFQINSLYAMYVNKAKSLRKILNKFNGTTNISNFIYNNQPLNYNMNLVNVLQQLAIIGNRTFPY